MRLIVLAFLLCALGFVADVAVSLFLAQGGSSSSIFSFASGFAFTLFAGGSVNLLLSVGLYVLGVATVFTGLASIPAVAAFSGAAMGIFRLSHKSDRTEFTLYLKLVALGIVVVGTIGFIIRLVGNIFFG